MLDGAEGVMNPFYNPSLDMWRDGQLKFRLRCVCQRIADGTRDEAQMEMQVARPELGARFDVRQEMEHRAAYQLMDFCLKNDAWPVALPSRTWYRYDGKWQRWLEYSWPQLPNPAETPQMSVEP